MTAPLPEFEHPPVVETLLGAQFAPIDGLTSAHFGLFWRRLGTQWQSVRESDPVGQIVYPAADVEPWTVEPVPKPARTRRFHFTDATETRTVQVENGWLTSQWNRRSWEDPYPRFAATQQEFASTWAAFEDFLGTSGLARPDINLWEVTYVNDFDRGTVWDTPADWFHLLPGLLTAAPSTVLDGLHTLEARWAFAIRGASARIDLVLTHGRRRGPIPAERLRLVQTARGPAHDRDSLAAGLELGHRTIVQAFAEITSAKAKAHWVADPANRRVARESG